MPKHNAPALTPAEQHKLFKQTARELGTDESEEAFDKVLGKIASAPPPKTVQKRKSKKRSKTKALKRT